MKFQVTRRPWYHRDRPAWMVWPAAESDLYPCYKVQERDNGDLEVFVHSEDERYALYDAKFHIDMYIKEKLLDKQWRKDFGQV